jgi:hypothetical protein
MMARVWSLGPLLSKGEGKIPLLGERKEGEYHFKNHRQRLFTWTGIFSIFCSKIWLKAGVTRLAW